LISNSTSGGIQERHSQALLLTRRGEPIKKQRSNKFSTGNLCPRHKGHIKSIDPVTAATSRHESGFRSADLNYYSKETRDADSGTTDS
jgi:hypothetical protein